MSKRIEVKNSEKKTFVKIMYVEKSEKYQKIVHNNVEVEEESKGGFKDTVKRHYEGNSINNNAKGVT